MKFLLVLFIFPVLAYSNCVDLAHRHGDGQSLVDLTSECFDDVKEQADKKQSVNGEINMYGYENMVFMEFSDIEKYQVRPAKNKIVIAGSELGFEKFEDGIILGKRKQILILSNKKLLVFRMNVGGNVAPLFSLESEHLENSESMSLDEKGKIIVSYRGSSLKKVFQLDKKKISYLAEVE